MSKKSKPLPLMITRGFGIMLNALPAGVLIDRPGAEQAIQRYCSRPDNSLTSAFCDLLHDLRPCLDTNELQETDVENVIVQVKAEFQS